jgi:hypothetical protein
MLAPMYKPVQLNGGGSGAGGAFTGRSAAMAGAATKDAAQMPISNLAFMCPSTPESNGCLIWR